MIVRHSILKITTMPPIESHGNTLRGCIANRFPQYDILHNHKKDGNLLYIYPRVQFRVIKGEGYIIGIEEGANLQREIEPQIEDIELNGHSHLVAQKQLIFEDVNFGLTDFPCRYRFIKPWLALNERNYSFYKKLRNPKRKEDFLKDILTGNLLSIAKSLGYIVDQKIQVAAIKLHEQETFLKGTPMLGFLGTFSVNFEIPNYWGIGKSVSRGFGTVKKS
ncbi:hypothetical protein M1N41_00965 [Thermodesulfovibrionales bacterium]|nr:hypothetical protein [Thermodesulfovibrionales bacterium]